MSQSTPQEQQEFRQARKSRDPRFDGRFFVGVKTTGIFCRNVCRVRLPKEENVTYFNFAAQAMQAGFRPCLRCRPDSAPGSFAWQGVTTTLARAMQLLKNQPHTDIQHLCEKLGISDSYLRKLFRTQLGISPKHFQIAEQLLLAKRLLHETQLSVEQIAHCSGFNSARRLQDNMMQHLKLSPSQVRQTKPIANRPLRLHLYYRAPYNWPQLRDFLSIRAIANVETVTEHSYSRQFTLKATTANASECHGYFRATHQETQNRFEVDIELNDYQQLNRVLSNLRRILDLDTDSSVIEQQLLAAGIPQQQLVTGLRLPGVWSELEAGVRAILGQQVSIQAAITHLTRLVESCDYRIADKLYFPTAEHILNNPLDVLKMPNARKQCLHRLAEHIKNGNDLAQKTEQEQLFLHTDLKQWQALKGIGPWTVAYAEMRGQSNPDIWLNTDLVIKKQLQKQAINADLAIPWRSYLTFQLWSMA